MKNSTRIIGALLACLASAGCAEEASQTITAQVTAPAAHSHASIDPGHSDGANRGKTRAYSTVKAGASVDFRYSLAGEPALNENGSLTMAIAHEYRDATITLQAESEGAVELTGGDTGKTVYVAEPGVINWDIAFTPRAPGVHYINLFAQISKVDGYQSAKSYGVRIAVAGPDGDIPTAQKPAAAKGIIMMDAAETIVD